MKSIATKKKKKPPYCRRKAQLLNTLTLKNISGLGRPPDRIQSSLAPEQRLPEPGKIRRRQGSGTVSSPTFFGKCQLTLFTPFMMHILEPGACRCAQQLRSTLHNSGWFCHPLPFISPGCPVPFQASSKTATRPQHFAYLRSTT